VETAEGSDGPPSTEPREHAGPCAAADRVPHGSTKQTALCGNPGWACSTRACVAGVRRAGREPKNAASAALGEGTQRRE
jgi:hypothetical protein